LVELFSLLNSKKKKISLERSTSKESPRSFYSALKKACDV